MKRKTEKGNPIPFFEKQNRHEDTCRMHAINNALGESVLWRER